MAEESAALTFTCCRRSHHQQHGGQRSSMGALLTHLPSTPSVRVMQALKYALRFVSWAPYADPSSETTVTNEICSKIAANTECCGVA
jgi:hypothetical protein